jgi:[histone H3]-lysine36 N-trimethyltransferase
VRNNSHLQDDDEGLPASTSLATTYVDSLDEAQFSKRLRYEGPEEEFQVGIQTGSHQSEGSRRDRQRFAPPTDDKPKVDYPLDPMKQILEHKKTVLEQKKKASALIAAVIAATAVNDSRPESVSVVDEGDASRKNRSPDKHQSKEEREKNKEKRLMKLVGAVVVKCMSKYRDDIDHDLFKKHAKEVGIADLIPFFLAD